MVDGGEPGVDSRDEGKHTGRNDLGQKLHPLQVGSAGLAWLSAAHALS